MSQSLSPVVSTAPSALSAQQEQVLALLAAGSTTVAAAEAAGVHRNTVAYWRRTSRPFRDGLTQAQHDKAQLWRERAGELAASALDALKTILTDPKTPAGVRLKAALAILDQASAPPPDADPYVPSTALLERLLAPLPSIPELLHKSAQTAAIPGSKTGRNEMCPCGSGKKFKRCCLNTPESAAAAASVPA